MFASRRLPSSLFRSWNSLPIRPLHSRPHILPTPTPHTSRKFFRNVPYTPTTDEDFGYGSTMLESAKLLIATVFGVVAGQYIAIHGAAKLEEYEIFKYVPDDDDDDEGDGGDAKSVDTFADELKDVFGDFRLSLAFHWSTEDANVVELSKHRASEVLAQLQEAERDGGLKNLAKEEVVLAIRYLKAHMEMLDKRIKEMKK
ncbi:hypothetical protein BC829DRAFT_445182 [Chytridium lagenaria]|nr:hypothetical protein BC829DRAFT_445182 [Chytridium lagenaria]